MMKADHGGEFEELILLALHGIARLRAIKGRT
jgi:hypothetical protein